MKGTKTSLFLIELMISLLLFAFCAAICVQLFHASNKRTQSAEDLSKAVFEATSAAEIYKSAGGDIDAMAENYNFTNSMFSPDSGTLTIFFDEKWNLTMSPMLSSKLYYSGYNVSVYDNGDGSAGIAVSKITPVYSENVVAMAHEEIFAITVKAVVS